MSMSAYFLDVGQGDSTFVILPNGETMLVDCDITGGIGEFDSDHPVVDPVEFIKPLLNEEDIDCRDGNKQLTPVLDHLVITHPHEDHYSGFDMLTRRYHIKNIWESGHRLDSYDVDISRYYARYAYVLDNPGNTRVHIIKASRNPVSIGGAEAYFFGPSQYLKAGDDLSSDAIHARCVVFKLLDGKYSILFAGDSDWHQWQDRIVPNYSDDKKDDAGKPEPNLLDSTILHASHHGSRSFFKDKEGDDPYTTALKKISP